MQKQTKPEKQISGLDKQDAPSKNTDKAFVKVKKDDSPSTDSKKNGRDKIEPLQRDPVK